jgi:LemA protein
MLLWIILAAIAATLIYALVVFNGLVRARQMVNEAWSGIDVQLKRRSDLIPNLVDSVKGYAAHERSVLEDVTQLRGAAGALPQGDVAARAQAEGALSAALGRLFAVAENYPDLKASGNFLQLQQQLSDLENEIQMARRYYNGAVRNLNVLVQSFPSNIIAGLFGFDLRGFFELAGGEDAVRPRSFILSIRTSWLPGTGNLPSPKPFPCMRSATKSVTASIASFH